MNEAQSLSSIEKAWLQGGEKTMLSSGAATRDRGAATLQPQETRLDSTEFRPSILTPIHEVPIRSRLHTAETDLIQNCVRAVSMPTTLSNNALEADDDTGTQRDDVSSVVSSLSKDDSLLPRTNLSAAPSLDTEPASPPTEVSFPNQTKEGHRQCNENPPDWLNLQQLPPKPRGNGVQPPSLLRDQSAPAVMMERSPPPRVRTAFASPKVLRPTLGRNQSCPASNNMDFSIASRTTTPSSSCGDSIDALFNNDADSLSLSPNSQKLLNGAKMRTHRRVKSCGTHSFLTAPTLATCNSYAGSEGSSVRRSKSAREASRMLSEFTGADDGAACCMIQAEDSFRRRSVVKEEFRHVMNLVSTPIKKLPLIKKMDPQQNLDLKRRKGGCLT